MLTFDLAVLSHCADLPPNTTAPPGGWTKVTRGLLVVFDTFRSGAEPLVTMKIMQASQILYDVPLQDLINKSKPIIDRLHKQGIDVSSQAQQLCISGMASSPLLALRYSLPEVNKVRRIQLKFVKPTDFDVAYDHVRELGLWFTPVMRSRPAQAVSPAVRAGPSCPPSQLAEISQRPSTAMPSSSTPLDNLSTDLRPSTASFFGSTSTASSRRPDSAASMSSHPARPDTPLHTIRPNTPGGVSKSSHTVRANTPGSQNRPSSSDLPPRRELPFERLDTPDSRGNVSPRPESRPMSGIMGPPILPASALTPIKKTNVRADSHPLELPPLRKPTYDSSTFQNAVPQTFGNTTDGIAARPQSATHTSSYSAMRQMMDSAPVLSPPRPATSSDAIMSSPPATASPRLSGSGLSHPPSQTDDTAFRSNHNYDKETAADDLAAYANQPNTVRLDKLNDYIFQHLNDDNFLALVDDMQMAWARIGSGLE